MTFDLEHYQQDSQMRPETKFCDRRCSSFGDMDCHCHCHCQEFLSSHRRTDRQTESDAYEPTVQCAHVGSKRNAPKINDPVSNLPPPPQVINNQLSLIIRLSRDEARWVFEKRSQKSSQYCGMHPYLLYTI